MKSGIYTITNTINNKLYVGMAINLSIRKNSHWEKLRKNTHKNKYLQRSWNEYGESAFTFQEIERCEEEYLCTMEHYWANMLDSHNPEHGYNIRPTHPDGKPRHSEETRKIIGEKGKGRVLTEKQKQERRDFRHSEESKKKIIQGLKNRNPEVYKKVAEKHKEKWKKLREEGKAPTVEQTKEKRKQYIKEWKKRTGWKPKRVVPTPEQREKMRENSRKYEQRKRQLKTINQVHII